MYILGNDIKEEHNNEFLELKLRNEELEKTFYMKEKEIDALEASMKELEDMVFNIKKEKTQVEETLAVARRENDITSKCLDDVRNEMIILSSNVDTHMSVNKMLERKSSELQVGKREQDLHISELEAENLQLSERISSLEAQLRYLTDEKEANRSEIEEYKSHIVDIKDEISQNHAEIIALNVEHRKKLQEVQKPFPEEPVESEVLKRSYSSTVESLMEECSLLQKQAEDLRGQKLEMREQISHLVVELRDLQNKNSGHLQKVKFLEEKLSLFQSVFTLKGDALAANLERIQDESKDQEQKLSETNVMLKQINQEKMVEIEKLKLELFNLSTQVYSAQDEQERIANDVVAEVSVLRSEKNKLENSLLEVQSKVKLYEIDLHNLSLESDNKVEGLVSLLNASKESEEMLMADIEHMQRMTESLKSSEDAFRKMANELEQKLKASDYEKKQLIEEVSSLKIKLQNVTQFQNELIHLKTSFEEVKFEKEKLEYLLHSSSEECKELKAEKVSFSDKISLLQKALHDSEDDRRSRVALEEKLLRLEADLATREESCIQETETKSEINRIKRVNSEYRLKIHGLEDEKGELTRKDQVLEKELSQSKVDRSEEVIVKVKNEFLGSMDAPQVQKEVALLAKIQSLQTELTEALEAKNIYQMQLNGFLSEKDSKAETSSKISSLETELREMRERYLHMSLQYAEVEANREELVMQLKSVKKEKKWFS
ncbi:hypothetical protein KSP39_PZI014656 [Platanthera zijinensis]|uniref:Uncharacterized protein n=1 Tax=Platanthera zijinensis TaxID=2320716 RepID=A0AAP0G279_9ASPA